MKQKHSPANRRTKLAPPWLRRAPHVKASVPTRHAGEVVGFSTVPGYQRPAISAAPKWIFAGLVVTFLAIVVMAWL